MRPVQGNEGANMSRNLSEVIRLNRRQFLQGFAAVGATITIPHGISEATSAQIEKAWAELAANPWYFDVAGNIIIDP
jgi:hypothetical protein